MKIIRFLFFTFILGLIQLWTIALIMLFVTKNVNLDILLRDGGIFFFSSSLIFNSCYILYEKGVHNHFSNNFLIQFTKTFGIIIPIIVLFLIIVIYCTVFSTSLEKNKFPKFIGIYSYLQIIILFIAMAYSIFVSAITGMFVSPKRRKQSQV